MWAWVEAGGYFKCIKEERVMRVDKTEAKEAIKTASDIGKELFAFNEI
jgi:hypothetical protein